MDADCKSKRPRKRRLQNENETTEKKTKIIGKILAEEIEVTSGEKDFHAICSEKENEFNGKSLRILFAASNGMDSLRKFVVICKENKEKDLAAEYLLAGGSLLEILKLMESSDKKNSTNATTVFSAMHIVLMRILAQYPQYRNSAIEACRHLLNSYISVVHSMLSIQSNAKQRKIILKLLAAMVSLGDDLSKELLAHLSLQQQVLETMVRRSEYKDSRDVRICFIHFVMAFLVEANSTVIRMLLNKHCLLSCIFPDLLYDSKDIVNLVLATVKTHVLENINISKTTKLHIFSTPMVLNLISLYNWKGPNYMKNKIRAYGNGDEEFLTDKETVKDLVHEFLIILLSSHRYGIIFHDRALGTSRDKHNQLVHTVLQNLEKPWEHEKPSDLIIKILTACPDLILSQYGTAEPFFEPRESSKWISLVRFIKKIIESVNPNTYIKTCSLDITTNHWISALLSLTVPTTVVTGAILPGLNHESRLVRHEVLILLLAMLRQLKAISLCTKASAVQNYLTDFILRTIPNLEIILRVWNETLGTDVQPTTVESAETAESVKLLDHLDVILDILGLYKDVCPELLDGPINCEPNTLLSALNRFENGDNDGDEGARMRRINIMKIRVIQFLLALDPSIFAPTEKAFKEALLFLICHILDEEFLLKSYNTVKALLNATGLFEACDEQSNIWINGFSVITDPEESKELTKWFMSVLKRAIKNTDKYISAITNTEITMNEQISNFDANQAGNIINNLFETINESGKEVASYERSDDTINVNKVMNGNLSDAVKHTDKCETHINQRLINFDVEKAEDIINELCVSSFSTNLYSDNKDFSTSESSVRNKLLGTMANFFEKIHEENVNSYKIQSCSSISPLLYCALQKMEERNHCRAITAYLSYVIIHTLYHQIVPEPLIRMSAELTDLPIHKYLQGWSSNNEPVPLKTKLPFFNLLRKFSGILLLNSKMEMAKLSELFHADTTTCCFEYNDQEVTIKHSLSVHDITALLTMTTYYLTQLSQRSALQRIRKENYKMILVSLLNIAQSIDTESVTIVEESAKCFFTHPTLLHYFSPLCGETWNDSVEGMITEIIVQICKVFVNLQKKCENVKFSNILCAFKNKFLAQLQSTMKESALEVCGSNHNFTIALIEILPLRTQEIAKLLLASMKLENHMFISSDKQNLSVFGKIVPILLDMCCDEEAARSLCHDRSVLNKEFVWRLSSRLLHLKSKKINQMERWEEAFVKYISTFSCDITDMKNEFFASLLTEDVSPTTIQIISKLSARNVRLIPCVMKYLVRIKNLQKQRDIAFALLSSNLKYKWDKKFLQDLYERYGGDIATYLRNPENSVCWIIENTAAVAYLLENTFNLALCEDISNSLLQSGDKMEAVSIGFVQLLDSLYKRYEDEATIKEKPLTDSINIFLHIVTLTLKKESKNNRKIQALCEKLRDAVIRLKDAKADFTFSSLSKSHCWPQFTRFSLKLALKKIERDDGKQCDILKTLNNLCDIAYKDNGEDGYVATLFEMATSHSEFVNVMLGSNIIKENLVELLWILIRKRNSTMTASHVPLLFAAYNATLSRVDQRILQILQRYEAHGIKMQQYWPYLWGNAAAIRYSVKGQTDTVVWRQPSSSEIFNSFDIKMVNETIKNYPVYRALKEDRLHENSGGVYDPAFYLPLLCSLLEENNVVACHKITQSGALALALAACCSDSSDVRMASYTIVSRYYFHLEASRSKEKLLWMRLIDALRNGVMSESCPLKEVRPNCLVSTFLARTCLVASQPLHPLYSPLHTFLMAKPALDINTIPELLQLLRSSHVEYKAHRHWILESIRDGMKREEDVKVALKCVLFKILLDLHTSVLSDATTKRLILEIVISVSKISKACLLLVRGYGLLSWLHEAADCSKQVEATIAIMENLLESLEGSTEGASHYKLLLLKILLRLKRHICGGTAIHLRDRYANILRRVIVAKSTKEDQGAEIVSSFL